MYQSLLSIISSTLAEVTEVKDSFSVPKTKLTKFPCAFFKPVSFNNTFETQSENMAVYRFMLIVMVGTNSNLTPSAAFGTILPKTVDAIVDKFNEKWNGGTIDGHRVQVKIDSVDAWEISEEQDGVIAYAPLAVEFRLLTSN